MKRLLFKCNCLVRTVLRSVLHLVRRKSKSKVQQLPFTNIRRTEPLINSRTAAWQGGRMWPSRKWRRVAESVLYSAPPRICRWPFAWRSTASAAQWCRQAPVEAKHSSYLSVGTFIHLKGIHSIRFYQYAVTVCTASPFHQFQCRNSLIYGVEGLRLLIKES